MRDMSQKVSLTSTSKILQDQYDTDDEGDDLFANYESILAQYAD